MMAHLKDPPSSSSLRAITINGSIHVESEEDVAKRREQRRRERKSRWGRTKEEAEAEVNYTNRGSKRSSILLPEDDNAITSHATASSGPPPPPPAADLRMSTMIDASSMDEKSQRIYLCRLQIQEATTRLSRQDLGIPVNPRDRSPSPEPVYNSRGVRINTREERTRQRLVQQRNAAITRLKDLDPGYQPPSAYKYKNAQLEDRVTIPAEVCNYDLVLADL